MPSITAGTGVSSATQLGADVVLSTAIKDGEVKSADILDESILTSDIKDGEIVNADISASAAIADTKLAQITTASKVSGAALTSLASIPAGAGLVPTANLPSLGAKVVSSTTDVTVANPGNNVNTTLYTLAIPGGTLGTANKISIKFYISSESLATNGTDTITFKYGGSTIYTYSIAGASLTVGFIEIEMIGAGTTSSQEIYAKGFCPTYQYGYTTAAIDSTVSQNLTVDFICTATNPGDSITFGGIFVEKAI